MDDATRELIETMAAQIADLHALYKTLEPLIAMGLAGGMPMPSANPLPVLPWS